MFNSGKPQMLQSDGKKIENRLSAMRRTQPAATGDLESRATIECLFLSTAASPARIRSSLLLKTASSIGRGQTADNLFWY
jgi:hypothetical protein